MLTLTVQALTGCRREVTPPEVRAAREREKELAELDRDIRTVFAYNLNLKAEEKDLFQFFSTAGKVLDVRIISDRNTRRSKGFAYIEYARRVRQPICRWLLANSGAGRDSNLCMHNAIAWLSMFNAIVWLSMFRPHKASAFNQRNKWLGCMLCCCLPPTSKTLCTTIKLCFVHKPRYE